MNDDQLRLRNAWILARPLFASLFSVEIDVEKVIGVGENVTYRGRITEAIDVNLRVEVYEVI